MLPLTLGYIRNNLNYFAFVYLLLLLVIVPGVQRFFLYLEFGHWLALARSNGLILNITFATCFLLAYRNLYSFFRRYGLGRFLPLDHFTRIHKGFGWLSLFCSILHTVGHIFNMGAIDRRTGIPQLTLLTSVQLRIGTLGCACLTGWILCVIFGIMWFTSLDFIRRSGQFEVFYYSHFLYILLAIGMFFHSPNFWYYFILPGFLGLIEVVSRLWNRIETNVVGCSLLPSKVTCLVLNKPPYFKHCPGDFVYLNIPAITSVEWHPITISSAPESEFLTLHIRAVGEWSNRLHEHFQNAKTIRAREFCRTYINRYMKDCANEDVPTLSWTEQDLNGNPLSTLAKCNILLPIEARKQTDDEGDIEMDLSDRSNDYKRFPLLKAPGKTNESIFDQPLKILISGPFGAPSSDVFMFEHAVLISTGIGVTPFASILQSIIHRYRTQYHECPSCNYSWEEKKLSGIMKLRKVDFVWINRQTKAFEWLVETIEDLLGNGFSVPQKPEEPFLDAHFFVTGEKGQNRPESRRKGGISWTYRRPDFQSLFSEINQRAVGKVTVLFCGRPDVGASINNLCAQFKFAFKKEVF